MTRENFDQVMQHFLILRTSLEPQACALAANHASPQQTKLLAELMAEMRALHTQFDRERWIQVDTQFHQLIYEASGNPFLTSFANLFSSVYQSYFRAITGNEVIKLRHHQAIVDAILAGDSAGALVACQVLLKERLDTLPLIYRRKRRGTDDHLTRTDHDPIRAQYGRTTVDRRNGVLYAGAGRHYP